MTTIILTFCCSLLASLCFTPFAIRLAKHYNIVDLPSSRKVHKEPIPRIGSVAIFLAFCLPLLFGFFLKLGALSQVELNPELAAFAGGAFIAFGIGLFDDFHRLSPRIKFPLQFIAAGIAYAGGIRIAGIDLGFYELELGMLSLPVTIFWFLFFINAVNLIDGLDGLAAGVAFFVSMILLILTLLQGNILVALFLAALGGATLGFLKYNFNPAAIFMGDGGSYFLGFCLAALSIVGSMKSKTTVAILIPIIAMGVPLFDTLWAPIRRFILGRRMFSPDGEHLHHRLVKLGFSHRLAVMILYGATIGLGVLSLVLVHFKDEKAAIILFLLGTIIIFSIRKLGYLDFIARDNFLYWLSAISYEAGISRERRRFNYLQSEIYGAKDVEKIWESVCHVMQQLNFDEAQLKLESLSLSKENCVRLIWHRDEDGNRKVFGGDGNDSMMKIELPLTSTHKGAFGTLWMIKDVRRDPISNYTLRRVEHLRRILASSIEKNMHAENRLN